MQVSRHQKAGQIWANLAKFATKFKSVKFSGEVYTRVKFVRPKSIRRVDLRKAKNARQI